MNYKVDAPLEGFRSERPRGKDHAECLSLCNQGIRLSNWKRNVLEFTLCFGLNVVGDCDEKSSVLGNNMTIRSRLQKINE